MQSFDYSMKVKKVCFHKCVLPEKINCLELVLFLHILSFDNLLVFRGLKLVEGVVVGDFHIDYHIDYGNK